MLVWDTSRQQWKTLQQQEERERRALAESILQVGATREVEAEPAAGALEIKVTIGEDRPPRLRDVVNFEDMRESLVAYSEYEQQMHITNQDGGDRVLARRRELVDSATQMMVADAFYDGKPWVDRSEEELLQGLKTSASVDVQQTNDEDFCCHIFRVMKMDASVPVDSRVFMQKRALRKYLADSGLTEVVKLDGRQYTRKAWQGACGGNSGGT